MTLKEKTVLDKLKSLLSDTDKKIEILILHLIDQLDDTQHHGKSE